MRAPIVDEVRKHRIEHTRQLNSDLHQICEDLRKFESTLGDRIVTFEPKKTQPTRKAEGRRLAQKAGIA